MKTWKFSLRHFGLCICLSKWVLLLSRRFWSGLFLLPFLQNWTFFWKIGHFFLGESANKSTNKVQFRQMEKSIQKITTICIGFGNRSLADFFHDQTLPIADCEDLTIGHSLSFFQNGAWNSMSENMLLGIIL